jgi:hypothetical protein
LTELVESAPEKYNLVATNDMRAVPALYRVSIVATRPSSDQGVHKVVLSIDILSADLFDHDFPLSHSELFEDWNSETNNQQLANNEPALQQALTNFTKIRYSVEQLENLGLLAFRHRCLVHFQGLSVVAMDSPVLEIYLTQLRYLEPSATLGSSIPAVLAALRPKGFDGIRALVMKLDGYDTCWAHYACPYGDGRFELRIIVTSVLVGVCWWLTWRCLFHRFHVPAQLPYHYRPVREKREAGESAGGGGGGGEKGGPSSSLGSSRSTPDWYGREQGGGPLGRVWWPLWVSLGGFFLVSGWVWRSWAPLSLTLSANTGLLLAGLWMVGGFPLPFSSHSSSSSSSSSSQLSSVSLLLVEWAKWRTGLQVAGLFAASALWTLVKVVYLYPNHCLGWVEFGCVVWLAVTVGLNRWSDSWQGLPPRRRRQWATYLGLFIVAMVVVELTMSSWWMGLTVAC